MYYIISNIYDHKLISIINVLCKLSKHFHKTNELYQECNRCYFYLIFIKYDNILLFELTCS